jgi:hypothetical protein
MVSLKTLLMSGFIASSAAIEPAAIYDGGFGNQTGKVELRIGNGGAGQSGLIKGAST